MMTPPATCDSQPCLLMIRPQSCTATIFVQRTTPVSVSTSTSATCTPPTPLFDRPSVKLPVPFTWSMPSLAHASFHAQLLSPALILPGSFGSIVRSPALAPRRPAIFSNRASRAAITALSVGGEVPGQVVLPPDPCDGPY